MKVLAIDPGYERLGIAILEKEPRGRENLLYSETFQTSAKDEFIDRMFQLGQRVEELVETYQPDCLAIEKLFFNTNQKTATNVSETRGTIIYLAKKAGMEVYEYTPLQIKTAVAGHGRADKKAVLDMTKKLIDIPEGKRYDDEYDAIACGLTFFAYYRA